MNYFCDNVTAIQSCFSNAFNRTLGQNAQTNAIKVLEIKILQTIIDYYKEQVFSHFKLLMFL